MFSGCDLLDNVMEQIDGFQSGEENEVETNDTIVPVDTEDEEIGELDGVDEANEPETTDMEENQTREGTLVAQVKQELPFDDLLLAQGYEFKSLPNGLAVSIPYAWILVGDNTGEHGASGYEANFCYNLPLNEEQVANRFGALNNVTMDHQGASGDYTLVSTFTSNSEYESFSGGLEFYDDRCVNLKLDFEGDQEYYGEDPSTMVSDEERAEWGLDDEREAEQGNYDGDRLRSIPDGYEAALDSLRVYSTIADLDFDAEDVQSIEDKIRNNEVEMFDLVSGFPKVFPYEWYLLAENDDPMNSSWSGSFCTDTSMREAIWKHHMMLADHNADILEYSFMESPSMNEKGDVRFAFNDEHGTGSWTGKSQFYIDRTQDFQVHKCVNIEMEFSPESLQ